MALASWLLAAGPAHALLCCNQPGSATQTPAQMNANLVCPVGATSCSIAAQTLAGPSTCGVTGCALDFGDRPVSFDVPPETMTPENGWTVDGDETALGTESPGKPEPAGLFARARQGLLNYDFSDPRIVEGHFDPHAPFVGRNILLEIKV